MDQNPDVIRHNIEETRSALTEKLETLEHEVFGSVREATQAVTDTVENVKETVNSTVENVKETVQETVQTVKETFDLQRQVCRHPWPMFGGSVAAGFVLGSFLPADRAAKDFRSLGSASAVHDGAPPTTRKPEPSPREGPRVSLLNKLLEPFEPELLKLKGMAIGVTMGLVRDALKDRVPEQMVPDFVELVNNITTKMGGEPVHAPILDSPCPGKESAPLQETYGAGTW